MSLQVPYSVMMMTTIFIAYIFLIALIPIYWMVMSKIFAKNVLMFQNCISLGDIMHQLYGRVGLWIYNVCALLMGLSILTIQSNLFVKICSELLSINHKTCIILVIGIMVIHSLYGVGAIIKSSPLQLYVVVVSILLTIIYLLISNNSFTIHETTLQINSTNIADFLGIVFLRMMPATTAPFLQGYLMMSSVKQSKLVFFKIALVDVICTILVCVGILVVMMQSHVDTTIAAFANNNISFSIRILLIVGMFTLFIASTSLWLNTTAVILGYDVLSRMHNMFNKVSVMRCIVLCIGVIIIALVILSSHLMIENTLILVCALWNPIMLVPICAGLLGFRTKPTSLVVSTTAAAICMLAVSLYIGQLNVFGIMFGVIISFVSFIVTYYIIKSSDNRRMIPKDLIDMMDILERQSIEQEVYPIEYPPHEHLNHHSPFVTAFLKAKYLPGTMYSITGVNNDTIRINVKRDSLLDKVGQNSIQPDYKLKLVKNLYRLP